MWTGQAFISGVGWEGGGPQKLTLSPGAEYPSYATGVEVMGIGGIQVIGRVVGHVMGKDVVSDKTMEKKKTILDKTR
jgi:hypothetical protein